MVRIATRGSKLALWQAHFVKSELQKLGIDSQLNIIKTKGDKIQNLSFDKIEGKGFFTKEIEASLLNQESDMAIHSLKDLPTSNPKQLLLAGVSARANPFDCILINKKDGDSRELDDLIFDKMIVGTSSARRRVQFKNLYPQVLTKDIRGNVPTRIEKLRNGDFNAIILAKAGIDRLALDVSDFHFFLFNESQMIPAPAQGVLGYQCRSDNQKIINLISSLNHVGTEEIISIEREALNLIDGGCQTPFGAYCTKNATGKYQLSLAYAADEHSGLNRVTISHRNSNELARNAIKKLQECT